MTASVGPRPHHRERKELPEHQWTTCNGCPAFRVFDWHYFYCRHLGDQTKPDEWNAGWKRVPASHENAAASSCGLPEQEEPAR
jgi:hypothetical protein